MCRLSVAIRLEITLTICIPLLSHLYLLFLIFTDRYGVWQKEQTMLVPTETTRNNIILMYIVMNAGGEVI